MGSYEVKLVTAAAGLYSTFLYWGYLQEKITGADYVSSTDPTVTGRWTFPFVLNACVAVAAILAASMILLVTGDIKRNPSVFRFWWPAFTCTMASPFGYWSLRYINYPLLLLAKSCKLVPVMLVGVLMLGRKHSTAEYLAVLLITAGVALFSLKEGTVAQALGADGSGDGGSRLIGLSLVAINLLLDGMTNAEQDRINNRFQPSGSYMMLAVNLWNLVFHIAYLLGGWAIHGEGSELAHALAFCSTYPQVVANIAAFCACAGLGQLFIFFIIKEFGSMVSVTVSISRKFFSILISVVAFGHKVAWWQWTGVLCVFCGLSMSVQAKYRGNKSSARFSGIRRTLAISVPHEKR